MKKFIDFYMVTISPWCYLSLSRLKQMSEKFSLDIRIKPIDIFSIFKENDTKGVKERPIPNSSYWFNSLASGVPDIIPCKLNKEARH